MKFITISKASHACLYKRYSLEAGDFVTVGDSDGTYAREDKNTGAEYRCLGLGKKRNKIAYSSDLKVGLFYPPNTFIYGENEDGNNLSFGEIEDFTKKFWGCKIQRALLPKGYNKGQWTWYNSVYFCPVDFQPMWDSVVNRLKQEFKDCEIISQNDNFVEVGINS